MVKKAKELPDKFAAFRHKPSRRKRESYRPNSYDASVSEAKEILRERYRVRGYKVKTIRRRDWHFVVSFGEDTKTGRGKGPSGLKSVTCNWPYLNGLPSMQAAIDWIKEQWMTTGENDEKGKPQKLRRRRKSSETPRRKTTKRRNKKGPEKA